MKRLSELNGDEFMDVFNALSAVFPVLETVDIGELSKEETAAAQVVKAVAKLIPVITSKENRRCVWQIVGILDSVPADEVKSYPAPKLVSKIRKIFSEGELANFLSYAEE